MKSDELINAVPSGCILTPNRGGYYCDKHQKPIEKLNFNVDGVSVAIPINTVLLTHGIDKNNICKIHDIFSTTQDSVEYRDNDILFLVQLKNTQLAWVKKSSLDKTMLDSFVKQTCEPTCNTNKDNNFLCLNKTKTRGILLATYNCGFIVGYKELFGSESLLQVTSFYLDLIKFSISTPKYYVYDDACHIKPFIENPKNIKSQTESYTTLANKIHVIDKLHIQNHNKDKCLKECNPYKWPELHAINTMSCEQTNFWAGKYKHSTKHLSYERYIFFLYIVFDEFNTQKLLNQKPCDFRHIPTQQQLDDLNQEMNQQLINQKEKINKFAKSKRKNKIRKTTK